MQKKILSLIIILFTISVGLKKTAVAQSSSQKKGGSELSYRQVMAPKDNNANPLITLDLKDVLLEEVLRQIADQAKAGIYFNMELIPRKRISLHLRNVPLGEALQQVLEGTNLEAFSTARNILLRKRTGIQFLSNTEQKKVKVDVILVEGIVTDGESGETLPGVNLIVKGTNTGTSTDAEGGFQLDVPSLQDTLVVSYVGYQTQEIPINGQMELEIQLMPEAVEGDEIVVVGYGGEQQERNVTSSITSVSGDDIAKAHTSNLGSTFYGKVPGLQLIQRSGQPGLDNPMIFVRGIGSLSAGNSQPIFVLDGHVMRDMNSIAQLDQDAIESISVLKDASATAIYGVEGANGVIVVQTKRGREGPFNITANTSISGQIPTVLPQNVDSYTYGLGFNEAQMNGGTPPDQVRFSPEALKAFRTGSNPFIYPDVDWMDYMTKPMALMSNTDISISGGTEDIRYFVHGDYQRQESIIRGDLKSDAKYDFYEKDESYDRYNIQGNLDIDITPSTMLSVNAIGRTESRIVIPGVSWGNLNMALPYASVGIVDGKKVVTGDFYIPGPKNSAGADVFRSSHGNGYDERIRNALNLQFSATQDLDAIIEGLELQVKGAYNAYFTQVKSRTSDVPTYIPYFRTDVDPSAPGDSTIVFRKQGDQRSLGYSESQGLDKDWAFESRLEYGQDFGLHSVKGLILYNQRKDFFPGGGNTDIPRVRINTVSRFNYNYDNRYLLELSMGYNGSENFAEGRRFGFFPAMSAGWILTNEPYMPELSFLSFLKLRASYGIVGNDSGIGRFLYMPGEYNTNVSGYNFGYEVSQDHPGASEGRLGNPGVTWEKAQKQNYGIDLRLFDSRLDLSFDYFYEFRDNILTTLNTVPSYVAANLPAVNVGQVENKGYEAQITWQQQLGDFFYSVGGNVSHARNKVVYIDEVFRNEPYQRRQGQRVGQPFGYIFDGYYTEEDIANFGDGVPEPTWSVQPGFLKYKDLNGDGVLNDEDTRPVGYPEGIPEYQFGSNLNFEYKNVDLSMTWVAATGRSERLMRAPGRVPFGTQGNFGLRQWQWDGRWTPEKDPEVDDIIFPRFSLTAGSHRNRNHSDFWSLDASYIRLRNVQIGYTFSDRLLSHLGMNRIRIYASANNPLTFSKLMDTYEIDPEQSGRRFSTEHPVMKVYSIGIQTQF